MSSFTLQYLIGIAAISITTSPLSALSSIKDEVAIPVLLWDKFNNPAVEFDPSNVASEGIFPPRYLVGMLGSEMFLKKSIKRGHYFTFDLGNSNEAILSHPECLGCGIKDILHPIEGCPSTVPSCDDIANVSFCWSSHLNNHLPSYAFSYSDKPCFGKSRNSGNLTLPFNHSIRTCQQCSGGGSHSRFYTPVRSSSLHFLNHETHEVISPQVFPSHFRFGALIRTIPLLDRLWSNIGIGPRSSFLKQTGITSFMLRLRPVRNVTKGDNNDNNNAIVFHPHPSTYVNSPSVHYHIKHEEKNHKRLFDISHFRMNNSIAHGSSTIVHFFIDSGNAGISLNDTVLIWNLASVTGGKWFPAEDHDNHHLNLFVPESVTPYTAPDIMIALTTKRDRNNVVEVRIPAGVWVTHPFVSTYGGDSVYKGYRRTIFSTYHKNVLGLPFLSVPDVNFVFDDDRRRLYMVKSEKDGGLNNETMNMEQSWGGLLVHGHS